MLRRIVPLAFAVAFALAQTPSDTPATQKPVPAKKDADDSGPPKMKYGGAKPAAKPSSTKDDKPVAEIDSDADGKEVKRSGSVPKPSDADLPPSQRGSAGSRTEIVSDSDGHVLSRNKTIPETAAPRPAVAVSADLVETAAESAFAFTDNLPNFICDQVTWRTVSETRVPDWRMKDRVENELVFFQGKEEYRNIRINGKALKKGSPVDSGTWSMGEFGTILADIYSPATAAEFKYRGESMAAGRRAKVFDIYVQQPHSHWKVTFESTIYPAYSGAVWIDVETQRTLRIEMQAKQIPGSYKVDHLELALDYGWVTISGQKYLLPVKSENVGCFRGTFECSKNEIEFKNYRKFTAESQVLNVESDISFPQAESKVSVPGEKKKDEKKDEKQQQ